jgi:polyphosphate kinase 2 (PPK2 family)
MRNPIKRWKLSPMDLESRKRWVEYSKAKDEMLSHTDREKTPWYVVNADARRGQDSIASRICCGRSHITT